MMNKQYYGKSIDISKRSAIYIPKKRKPKTKKGKK